MKKLTAIVLATLLLLSAAALADEALIEKTVYEGMGVVDVDFLRDVSYSNLEITVQDQEGIGCNVTLWERDDDDLVFRMEDYQPGQSYSYTISGVRSGFTGEYGSVSGSFTVPLNEGPAIKKVEFDAEDREIDVEFYSRVSFEGAQLKITDASGREYESKIREVDSDGFEAYVPDLKRGESYVLEVSGVSDGKTTATAVFDFVAWDD